MVLSQRRASKKPTGKRYVDYRKKRKNELGGIPALTKIGPMKKRVTRTIGGNNKDKVLSVDFVNLADPKTKKFEKATIKAVLESPANRNFVRRNIITKGAIVDTDKGKARITSRPGQEGIVNAVLI